MKKCIICGNEVETIEKDYCDDCKETIEELSNGKE